MRFSQAADYFFYPAQANRSYYEVKTVITGHGLRFIDKGETSKDNYLNVVFQKKK